MNNQRQERWRDAPTGRHLDPTVGLALSIRGGSNANLLPYLAREGCLLSGLYRWSDEDVIPRVLSLGVKFGFEVLRPYAAAISTSCCNPYICSARSIGPPSIKPCLRRGLPSKHPIGPSGSPFTSETSSMSKTGLLRLWLAEVMDLPRQHHARSH